MKGPVDFCKSAAKKLSMKGLSWQLVDICKSVARKLSRKRFHDSP